MACQTWWGRVVSVTVPGTDRHSPQPILVLSGLGLRQGGGQAGQLPRAQCPYVLGGAQINVLYGLPPHGTLPQHIKTLHPGHLPCLSTPSLSPSLSPFSGGVYCLHQWCTRNHAVVLVSYCWSQMQKWSGVSTSEGGGHSLPSLSWAIDYLVSSLGVMVRCPQTFSHTVYSSFL